MEGCSTCRSRKVKCDGRPGSCARCEKLKIECKWGNSTQQISRRSDGNGQSAEKVTQAGYKRIRTSRACQTCRSRKLKCDSGHPSCMTCLRHRSNCVYDVSPRSSKRQRTLDSPRSVESDRPTDNNHDNEDMESREMDLTTDKISDETSLLQPPIGNRQSSTPSDNQSTWIPLPLGHDLARYLESYLTCVHPICFQNILHPGILSEGFEQAPRLLLLAICGASAKFISGKDEKTKGRNWIAEAKSIVMRDLSTVSTMNIVVLQTIALHDVHEAELLSAWNLTGISLRMARQLNLNQQSLDSRLGSIDSANFLEQECHRRLLWSVFVGDILLASDQIQISEDYVANVGLPCNLWNFTQGTPCITLRLHDDTKSATTKHATNPNGYLVRILALKRRIHSFVQDSMTSNEELPWLEGSRFNSLVKLLENFRKSLPANMKFEERHMYTFRTSHHLDMFLMIHVWYHACGCELFGTGAPGLTRGVPIDGPLMSTLPPPFSDRCEERCLSHARQISRLLERMIKVEPKHLFRDPWICLSIWDSTLIQVAAYNKNGDATDLSHYLKLNLRALENTKSTFLLADKTYRECCRVLHNAGLESILDGEIRGSIDPTMYAASETASIGLLRKYPFLSAPKQNDTETWATLFSATNFTGAVSRESSPEERTSTHSNSMFDGDIQSQPSMSDTSFLDEEHMQQFLPWHGNDFDWNETMVPAPMKISDRLPLSSVEISTETGQNLMGSFVTSYSPKNAWPGMNEFNVAYIEQS